MKEVKDLYIENYSAQKKEIEEGIRKCLLLGRKNQDNENGHNSQAVI